MKKDTQQTTPFGMLFWDAANTGKVMEWCHKCGKSRARIMGVIHVFGRMTACQRRLGAMSWRRLGLGECA